MSKKNERARISEAINEAIKEDVDFEEACEADGFTVCCDSEDGKKKKKANV